MAKIYNKTAVLAGIGFFLLLFTFPFWNQMTGMGNKKAPEPVLTDTAGEYCVEDKAYMRAKHMQLLDRWRNEVVRENKTTYTNSRGEHYPMSLTNTCLNCHSNKKEFCDTCHQSANVETYCFDCHTTLDTTVEDLNGGLMNPHNNPEHGEVQ